MVVMEEAIIPSFKDSLSDLVIQALLIDPDIMNLNKFNSSLITGATTHIPHKVIIKGITDQDTHLEVVVVNIIIHTLMAAEGGLLGLTTDRPLGHIICSRIISKKRWKLDIAKILR